MANGDNGGGLTPEQRREAERKRRAAESADRIKNALSSNKDAQAAGAEDTTAQSEPEKKPRRKGPGKRDAAGAKAPKAPKAPKTPKGKAKPRTITTSKYGWNDFIDDFVVQDPNQTGIDSWSLHPDLKNALSNDPSLAESILNTYDLSGLPGAAKQHLFGTSVFERTDEEGNQLPTAVTPELQIQETERRLRRGTAADSADDFDPTDPNYSPEEFTSVTQDAIYDELGKQGRRSNRGPVSKPITGLEEEPDSGTSPLEPFRTSGVVNTRQMGLVGGNQSRGDVPIRGAAPSQIQVTGSGRGGVAVPYTSVRPARETTLPSEKDLDATISALGSLTPSPDENANYEVLYLDPNHPAVEGRYGKRTIPRTNKKGKVIVDKKGNPVIAEEYHWMGQDDARAAMAAKGGAVLDRNAAVKEQYDAANAGTTAPERIAVRVPKDIQRTPEEILNTLSPEVHGTGTRLFAPQGLMPVSSARKAARSENDIRAALGQFIVRMNLERTHAAKQGLHLDDDFNFTVVGEPQRKLDAEGNPVSDESGQPVMEQPISRHNLMDFKIPEKGEPSEGPGLSRRTYDFLQDVQMSGIRRLTGVGSVTRPSLPATGTTREGTLPSGASTRSVNNMRYVVDDSGNINMLHTTTDESGNPVTNVIERPEISQKILEQRNPSGDARDAEMRLANPLDTSTPKFVQETRQPPFTEMTENVLAPKSPEPVEKLVTGSGSKEVTTLDPNYNPKSRRTGLAFSSTDLQGGFDLEGQKAKEYARDYQAFYMTQLLRPNESGKAPNMGLIEAQTGIPRRNVADTSWMRATTEEHPLSFEMADISHPIGKGIKDLADKHGLSHEDALRIVRKVHTTQALAMAGMKSPHTAYDERLWNAKFPLTSSRTPSDFEPMTIEVPDARGVVEPETGAPRMRRVRTMGIRPENWTNESGTGYLDMINRRRTARGQSPIVPGTDEEEHEWKLRHGYIRGQMTADELAALDTPRPARPAPAATETLSIQLAPLKKQSEQDIVAESMASMAEAGGPMSQATYNVDTAGWNPSTSKLMEDASGPAYKHHVVSERARWRSGISREAWKQQGQGSVYYSDTPVPKPQRPAPFVPRPSTVTEAEVSGTGTPEERHFTDVRRRVEALTAGGVNRPTVERATETENASDLLTPQQRVGRVQTMAERGLVGMTQFGGIVPAPLKVTAARKNELWDIQNPRLGPSVPPPEAPAPVPPPESPAPKPKRTRKPRNT